MKNALSDYEAKDGFGYVDDEECFYETADSLVQSGVLGFCGCGRPEDSLRYIRDGLALIDEVFRPDEASDYSKREAKLSAHFGTDGAKYFFYYWADKEEFTDHGGSVPGWLTEKGRDLLRLLNELFAAGDAKP